MPKQPKEPSYQKTLATHRQRLVKLAEDRGVSRLKRLYDRAHDELVSKIARSTRSGSEFSAVQHTSLLAQVKQGQAVISQQMAGESGDLSLEAQTESLRGLGEHIAKLEKKFTGADVVLPIDEAARFAGVIDRRRTSLLKQHASSMENHGARVVKRIEDELSVALATGETGSAAIERVRSVADMEWYAAERIVRTETAWAYNATQADGIEEIAEELDDAMMQWVEHCDEDGEPFDDRVGVDSMAMHGQLVEPGGLFVMPATAPNGERVPESLVGMEWAFPPNRPNDRAIVSMWRPHWGQPGWVWRGRRIWKNA